MIFMKCKVLYSNPVTGCIYYFLDFHSVSGILKPKGCLRFRRHEATVFETKKEAMKVVKYLNTLGYSYVRII